MRIALVIPGGVDRSGEYRVIPALLALIGRLALHHDVHVFALSQEPEAAEWDLAGAHIYNIGFRRTRPRAVRRICRVHRSLPFDIVHSIWSGACGMIAVVVGKILGIPSLIHVTGGELVALPEIAYGGRLTWRGRLREAVVLRVASAVTATSAPVIETLAQIGVPAQRVPLGIDLHAWPPRDPVRRRRGEPARLIHVASLNRVKDQSTLLRALASLMESGLPFEMDVVGDDTLHGKIQEQAEQLGLSHRVHFLGFKTQRQLRPLVEAADLMILSSRHEAGPFAMLEAAVAGVPTVGTLVGHISEWAPQAAVAVPVADAHALARAIAELLGDEDRRLRIAREALHRGTREDADGTAQAFLALYTKLIGAGRASRTGET